MPKAFSNWIEPGNELDDEPPNAGANDNRPDNFGNRKNPTGTGADTPFSSGYPLPPDPHAPPGDMNPGSSAEISDYGIVDGEVGHSPSQLQYGLRNK